MRDDVRHGLRIARTEVLRSWRWIFKDGRRAVSLGFLWDMFMFTGFFMAFFLYFAGQGVASGTRVPSDMLGSFGTMVTYAFVLSLILFVSRGFSEKGGVGKRDLLLTTVSSTSVVVGTVTAEFLRALAITGPFLLAFAVAFGSGLGSLVVVPAIILVSSVLLLALSSAFGYTLGLVLKLIAARLPKRPRLLKWTARVVAVVVGFVLVLLVSALFVPPLDFETPIAVYADIFFLGTPLRGPGLLTFVAVFDAVAATLFFVAAAIRLAPFAWYSETAEPSSKWREVSSKQPPGFLSGTKTRRIAWMLWHRGLRNPIRFLNVIVISFLFLLVLLPSVVVWPIVLGPPVLFLLGTFLSGALFGLNPLGEEGEMLRVLVTSTTPGRCFARARMLAGLLVSVPLVLLVLAFVPYRFSHGSDPWLVEHTLLVALGVYFSVCYVAIGVGLGVSYPRFEKVHPDRDFYPATFPASMGYLSAVFSPGLFALVLFILPRFYPEHQLVVRSVSVAGLLVLAAVTGVVARWSYAYSVRRFDTYTLD